MSEESGLELQPCVLLGEDGYAVNCQVLDSEGNARFESH